MDFSILALSLSFFIVPSLIFFFASIRDTQQGEITYNLSFISIFITILVWLFFGWSFAFGQGDFFGFFSDPFSDFPLIYSFNNNSDLATGEVQTFSQLNAVKLGFELIFPLIGVIIISAVVETKVRILAFTGYIAIWVALFYSPMAHMLWNGGFFSETGFFVEYFGLSPHDFNGALPVLIGSSVSALIFGLLFEKSTSRLRRSRVKKELEEASQSQELRVVLDNDAGSTSTGLKVQFETKAIHDIVHTLQRQSNSSFAILLVLFAWLIFNVGTISTYTTSEVGIVWLATLLVVAFSVFTWFAIEKIVLNVVTTQGIIMSILIGLATATPLVDNISLIFACLSGILSSLLSFFAIALVKKVLPKNPLFDYILIFFFGAFFGLIFEGIFSTTGWILTGSPSQLFVQLVAIIFTLVFATIISLLSYFLIDKIVGFKSE